MKNLDTRQDGNHGGIDGARYIDDFSGLIERAGYLTQPEPYVLEGTRRFANTINRDAFKV